MVVPRTLPGPKLIVALLAAALIGLAPARALEFATSELRIETAAGGSYRFTVELAVTPEQMARGLMFRTELAEDAGMLFVLDRERPMAFWMKNTLIPLDMLFIDRSGRIVRIHERAVPLSTTSIPSGQPVKAVLEINGGLSARLGIRPGDRVVHEVFASSDDG